MKDPNYASRFKHANKIQEFFVNFMEKELGHKFVAGDRNGETKNIGLIERLFGCRYLTPKEEVTGPMLRFKCKDGIYRNFVMPDELFYSNGRHQFFDVKSRTVNTLHEKFETLSDYKGIAEASGISVYIAVVIWNYEEEQYDIYCRNVKNILEGYADDEKWNKQIPFKLSEFKKIT